ncbi:MAG: prolyl oligopeptidase family serine peptidase, partial [Chitinophagaceae bacterium]|nr:prolyl oligopeptidase family serine peptidase [Chitinophagaceae bacterium]
NSKLHIVNLKKQSLTSYDHVSNYQAAGKHLLLYDKSDDANVLTICQKNGVVLKAFKNITEYSLNPNQNEIAMSVTALNSFKIIILKLREMNPATVVIQNNTVPYQSMSWSADGQALAFYSASDGNGSVYCYRKNVLSTLDCTSKDCFSIGRKIQYEQRPAFSGDGKMLFFKVQQSKKNEGSPENQVQVWNTADKFIYTKAAEIVGFTRTAVQVIWNIETNKLVEVNDLSLPYGGAIMNGKFSLTFNPQAYEPQTDYSGKVDIYLTNLGTGNRKLFLQGQDSSDHYMMVSPEGRYVVYYRSPDWYIYDFVKDVHLNLTASVGVSFADVNSDSPGPPEAYQCAGWTKGDESLLLYDEYDVWEFFPDGKLPARLTNGREHGIVFRIVVQDASERSSLQSRVRTTGVFDLDKTVLLSAISQDYSKSGYYNYSRSAGLQNIGFINARARNAIQNDNRDVTAYIAESFGSPPEIFISRRGKTTSVFKSNRQHDKFLWGKTEIIHYSAPSGEPLSGILYCPADFKRGKQYPMIVNIYERQYSLLHRYWMPSICNGTGVNFANLSAQGYFVFLPDIAYNDVGVGSSAVECVETAVKKVLESGDIDASNIGLIGHSFGGYETDYIISQSNIFKCAVAGAAVTDLTSANHAIHRSLKIPNFFIIENGQFRTGGSIAEKKQYYIDNSPIYFAGDINTPLLSWTGLEDTQVEARQSIELYMAMRRLGKQHIMLLYPDEIHEILKRENTEDLTRKVESWFGHYLKGEPIESWMVPN